MSYPLYWGDPTISESPYKEIITAIDIQRPYEAIETIENCIENKLYEKSIEKMQSARISYLEKDSFFTFLDRIITENEKIIGGEQKRIKIHICCSKCLHQSTSQKSLFSRNFWSKNLEKSKDNILQF